MASQAIQQHPSNAQPWAARSSFCMDDSGRLAERAREAEVDVILDVTAGVPHIFRFFIGQLDEAGQALDLAALYSAPASVTDQAAGMDQRTLMPLRNRSIKWGVRDFDDSSCPAASEIAVATYTRSSKPTS